MERDTKKYTFLSLPHEATPNGELRFLETQNIKGLFLKKAFSPNAYAYAALVHPLGVVDKNEEELSKFYLTQAETYVRVGYDGMKILEGYPSMRKAMKRPLDDCVYDRYYSFLEENCIPVTMHIGNPENNYEDISRADEYGYENNQFIAVKLEKNILDKIYFKNAAHEIGNPKPIDAAWLRCEAEKILQTPNKNEEFVDADMKYVLKHL